VTQRPVIAQVIDPSGQVILPEGARSLLSTGELATALDRELLVDRGVTGIGGDARILAQPLVVTSHGRVVGVTATSTAALEHVRNRLVLLLVVASPALTAAVTLTAWVLAGAALRPVQRMAHRAETISMAAPGERLPQPPGHDEIAELGRTLNAMLERIESTIAHERAFIDDASHELRTPLAVLRGELELALNDDDFLAVQQGLRSSLEETDRLARLADDLLMLARADAGQASEATPANLTEAARVAGSRLGKRPNVTLTVLGQDAMVPGPAAWVDRIVTNLIVNALDHAHRAVSVEVSSNDTGHCLTVADDGPGFPADLLARVFDRFIRGDSARGRGGTGLGLAIVAALARSLGGEVHAGNGPPLGGARVEVTLPAAQPATSHTPLTPQPPPSRV
jgi:signal transduction histidine kinase